MTHTLHLIAGMALMLAGGLLSDLTKLDNTAGVITLFGVLYVVCAATSCINSDKNKEAK
jgi:hypothetical protein